MGVIMAFGDNLIKKEEMEKQPIKRKSVKTKKDKEIISDGFLFQLSDKWKLVSHLHKSIRHGEIERAKEAAKWIYLLDKNYARYRLAVIAFEDVAGANITLINEIMRQGWKNDEIEKNGGVDWFSEQAGKMAASVKNRFANDLCQCGVFINDYLDEYNLISLTDQPMEDAEAIAWDESVNYFYRAIAAWRITGTKLFPNDKLGKFEGDWDYWKILNIEHGVSWETIECMDFGQKTQNEGSPIFLGFAEKERERSSTFIENDFVKFPLIGPYSSSSIDKHTSEGKKALRLIVDNIKQNYSVGEESLFYLLGKIQFREEGGVLNPQLKFGIEKEVEKLIWQKYMKENHLNKEIYLDLLNTKKDWHEAREKFVFYKMV